MRFFKKILNFYIFSNIHVALAGFCLTKITLLKFGIPAWETPIFIALSIIISYNFIRYYEIKTHRLQWFQKWFFQHKKSLLVLSVSASLLLAYLVFFTRFNSTSLCLVFPFAFMTFFYAIPVFKMGKTEVSFRNFPFVKIFSIAFAWAGLTVFFPLYEAGYIFDKTVWIVFLQRFLILIAITLPFDIRDINTDDKLLKTLPQVLGVKGAKILGILLLCLFVLFVFFIENTYTANAEEILIAVITSVFLWFSSSKKTRYYTSFWVEAIPIFWLGLAVLIN